jgi:hypothetical protein
MDVTRPSGRTSSVDWYCFRIWSGHVLGGLVVDLPHQVRRDDSQVASDDLGTVP